MTVRAFDFVQVTSLSEDAKLIDPATQRRVNPISAVFATASSETMLTLFIDYRGELGKVIDRDVDKEKISDFAYYEMFTQMRKNKGLFCIVTKDIKTGCIPIEFHQMITLSYPPEELQIRQWEATLGMGALDDDTLVDLVERNPMHSAEIDFIARQAKVRSIMNGRNRPRVEDVKAVIASYRGKSVSPVLFGGRT